MELRNITFSLPVSLLRKAKLYAAQHDTTVNAMVRDLLDQKISGEDRQRNAAELLLKIAREGPSSSVDPSSYRREELYERR